MSQYLSKEEIKQWRSSLEKITLEEYARRLGKTLEEDKQTSDIIDMVMSNEKRLYMSKEKTQSKKQIMQLAKKAQDMQKDLVNPKACSLEEIKTKINLKKQLTEREDVVLEYFAQNCGKIVYARDLARLLKLPSDYVYKYIKNLRAKISEDVLHNATKGGYVLDL